MNRRLDLNLPLRKSLFLWGPRQVGKSYFLRHELPRDKTTYIDLLKTDVFAEYAARPSLLRERVTPGKITIIDEIQKIPALLDEVHYLIENKKAIFILSGSSARKIKRGRGNLLGGRAHRQMMTPLCFGELKELNLEKIAVSGLLPAHYLSKNPLADLRGYVSDYLKEEVAAEALTQNLPAFSDFLRVAAISSNELINYVNIAREVGVSVKAVTNYFSILEDTFLGYRLPPWRKSNSRRLVVADKFYLFDAGVTNFLIKRKPSLKSPEFGKTFEQLIFMELKAYQAYANPDMELRYWRTSTGNEVDFVINDKEVCIEAKSSQSPRSDVAKGLLAMAEEGRVGRKLVVTLEKEPRRIGDIEVMPLGQFVERLWGGGIV